MTLREKVTAMEVAATLSDPPFFNAEFNPEEVAEWTTQEMSLARAIALILTDITGHEYFTFTWKDESREIIHLSLVRATPEQVDHVKMHAYATASLGESWEEGTL